MAFLPACAPAAISLASCPDASPGISNIYYCQKSDIASVTVTSGAITAFTMTTGKVFYEISTDDQATTFTDTSADIRYASKNTSALTAQIPGLSLAIQKQLMSLKNCCELVFVVKTNTDVYKVMGYDVNYSASTATYKSCTLNQLNWLSQSTADDDYARFEIAATCTTTGTSPIFTGTLPV